MEGRDQRNLPSFHPSNFPFFRLPWPALAMGAGVSAAILALALVIFRQFPGLQISALLLSLVLLAAGFVGIYRSVQQEKRNARQKDTHAPPRVYRKTLCEIDLPFVQNLARLEVELEQRCRTKGWEVDWETHRRHREAAQALVERGELANAFREHCWATALLTAASRRQRKKEEVFQPLW